ncbi:MAG: hypothetical protein ACXACP_01375 [Candidatus Hodarchaeales archaeon]
MKFPNLYKRRRGQIRAVDFIISLLLFLLMLSQLLLIIINVQTGLNSQMSSNLITTELDTFSKKILFNEGPSDWGYEQILPNSFGLASASNIPSLSLDAAKIARIITGTTFPISSVSGFEQFSYETLKTLLGIGSEIDFQVSLIPLLDVSLTVTDGDIINITDYESSVTVTNLNGLPVENCNVNFFTLNLVTGMLRNDGIKLSDANGEVSNIYIDPNINDPTGEHLSIAIAEKGPLWGVSWGTTLSSQDDVLAGKESQATLWVGGLNESHIIISDIHEALTTPDSHYLSFLHRKSQPGFLNTSYDISSVFEGNISIPMTKTGPVVVFSTVRVGNTFKVGIETYPAILDSDSTSGTFYQVFGKSTEGIRETTKISKDYPVVVRETLMLCRLIYWRN